MLNRDAWKHTGYRDPIRFSGSNSQSVHASAIIAESPRQLCAAERCSSAAI